VLLPDITSVPGPLCVTLPLPLMTLLRATVPALSDTRFPVAASVPPRVAVLAASVLAILSVLPAAMDDAPVTVPSAVSVAVPLPCWAMAPLPLTAPAKVMPSLRLKASVAELAPSVTGPSMLPLVPPWPSDKVPALRVVPPL
jgi:hypothetical protein